MTLTTWKKPTSSFKNLHRLLRAAQAEVADIMQGRAFLGERSYFPLIENRWSALFPDKANRPVLHSIAYNAVPHLRVLLEIIAMRTSD
jgi:enamine deaminase RidA (YjgF/YER057c/UK114 family)